MDKTAVDAKTKKYWNTYFKEYGQMWTRDIPRRIKNAVKRIEKVSAIEGDVAPIGSKTSNNGDLFIEAAFVGQMDGRHARVLVTASFTQQGKMKSIDVNRIS